MTAVNQDLLVHLRRARDHAYRHDTQDLDLDALAAIAGGRIKVSRAADEKQR